MDKLAAHIQTQPLIDTHEHLNSEAYYLDHFPDLLQSLFDNYVPADLVVAGASLDAVERLLDASDPDLVARFEGVRTAWEACQHTGYGQAVRLIASLIYAIDEITPETLQAAQPRHAALHKPGERLRLLRDVAGLEHVQIDNFTWQCPPDVSGSDFFLYDLSWVGFCRGDVAAEGIYAETGITVSDVASWRRGMQMIFERQAPTAIAVKSQHAYERTLLWRERSDEDVAPIVAKVLAGLEIDHEQRLCLGDWALACGVELAIEHDLPFKIHTGYYAGHSRMPVDRIRSGHLCELLKRYPDARFVLMHTAYPYSAELVALAKHYRNVYVDMCWAWSIDPYSACDFVRRMIHTVPANKLLVFGGDTFWPTAAVAYSSQARTWLTRALQAEVDDGLLSEQDAIVLATRLMRGNQEACFDIIGRRNAISKMLNVK